jgi:2-(1,2-epoxy-1,2-dihydrophenyl)acetyl-CoA isomerase
MKAGRTGGAMEDEVFRVEIADGVARCTMNGPTMNAMGTDLLPSLFEGLDDALSNDDVRVIVLRGEGGNFCVGADLSIMGEKMDPAFLYENMKKINDMGYRLHEGPKPVITEVDGWAAGGGFSLAICSDITYATERAQFYMSFVRIAIIPDLGVSYYLPRRVGLARAKELALAAKRIDAEEAYRIGLINGVIDHESISGEVMKTAKRMATCSPVVLEMTKRNLNWSDRLDLKTMLDNEASTQPFLVMAPEHQEAIKKFMEKQGGGKGQEG